MSAEASRPADLLSNAVLMSASSMGPVDSLSCGVRAAAASRMRAGQSSPITSATANSGRQLSAVRLMSPPMSDRSRHIRRH